MSMSHFLTLSTDNCVYRYMYQVGMSAVSKDIKNVTKENATVTVSCFSH